ncbi:uncharacterized protein LOC127010191 [Eriocheir sinensis]|uniref:uncharacterized protein LOC127010191 n=1 Tax=Eriocheir sinensis TaxID=95602 RepID=UPI0021C6C010|nr:uncharacterized protein LOC127010191 [Eriocheir sinensis]
MPGKLLYQALDLDNPPLALSEIANLSVVLAQVSVRLTAVEARPVPPAPCPPPGPAPVTADAGGSSSLPLSPAADPQPQATASTPLSSVPPVQATGTHVASHTSGSGAQIVGDSGLTAVYSRLDSLETSKPDVIALQEVGPEVPQMRVIEGFVSPSYRAPRTVPCLLPTSRPMCDNKEKSAHSPQDRPLLKKQYTNTYQLMLLHGRSASAITRSPVSRRRHSHECDPNVDCQAADPDPTSLPCRALPCTHPACVSPACGSDTNWGILLAASLTCGLPFSCCAHLPHPSLPPPTSSTCTSTSLDSTPSATHPTSSVWSPDSHTSVFLPKVAQIRPHDFVSRRPPLVLVLSEAVGQVLCSAPPPSLATACSSISEVPARPADSSHLE